MNRMAYSMSLSSAIFALALVGCGGLGGDEAFSNEQSACEALAGTRNLTITSAYLVAATETTPQYCYVKGIISPAIVYHVQLPLPENWVRPCRSPAGENPASPWGRESYCRVLLG